MQRLLLVRHASSVLPTPDGPSERERPLSGAGAREAEALVELLVPYRPARVLSSPYRRAVQTVLPTAAALGLPVEPCEALREWHSGIGATPDWEPHYRYCWENPDEAAGTGETHRELEARALAAVQEAAAGTRDGSVTVLGSHGTWIARALHALGCDVDAEFWLDMPKPAVYEVVLGDEAPVVRGRGIAGSERWIC